MSELGNELASLRAYLSTIEDENWELVSANQVLQAQKQHLIDVLQVIDCHVGSHCPHTTDMRALVDVIGQLTREVLTGIGARK